MMDTMSPVARGVISLMDQASIRVALEDKEAAERDLRLAVLFAAGRGASVRELAKFTGLSTNTISRWKRESK